ncbi:unnamed protein product [Lactuca saligna]|uniref:Uncharacterized protein n=1 Tax=Lactuca saligna TaxID=75948 RepID=A0AA36DUH7_LACSI|nr:unnamed protein product [Lactuca saligna]
MKETQNNNKGTSTIILEDIPGGATSFLAASKFCYGVHIEPTPTNIVMVYHVSDYLEMTDEYGDDKLFSRTVTYFHKIYTNNRKDFMVALQSCETIVTKSRVIVATMRNNTSISSEIAVIIMSYGRRHGVGFIESSLAEVTQCVIQSSVINGNDCADGGGPFVDFHCSCEAQLLCKQIFRVYRFEAPRVAEDDKIIRFLLVFKRNIF